MEPIVQYIVIGVGCTAGGFALFLVLFGLIKRRLNTDQSSQHKEILHEASQVAGERKQYEIKRQDDRIEVMKEDLEDELKDRKTDADELNKDIDSRYQSLQSEENRIRKRQQDVDNKTSKANTHKELLEEKRQQYSELQSQLMEGLSKAIGEESDRVAKNMVENMVEARQIQAQKVLRNKEEELESNHKRVANRTMARTLARYAPDFYWPKMINHVEVSDPKLVDRLGAEGPIEEIKEKSGVEVDLMAEKEQITPIVKFAGGAGINREACRLTFTDLLGKKQGAWHKAAQIYDEHRAELEKQAIKLGEKAVIEVGIAGLHPEIQKLVGYLNWRTSYRQNQWHHTVEVAKLAGILAFEVGVDPDEAKRCGMLHDIGKAIDYRIEGSHAVISGDYADRFGESRLICDTVMSHHNDLVLETPLSYVLKSADTLSGARPGARVNLEEGYQSRLSDINHAVRSFAGIVNVAIMNGAREVHVEVNNKKVSDAQLEKLGTDIAKKITDDVAFPGEIKILVTRRFEATSVA